MVFFPLLAIYFADCRSATFRDLDASIKNKKVAFISLEEGYPEVYDEWVNHFVKNQVNN